MMLAAQAQSARAMPIYFYVSKIVEIWNNIGTQRSRLYLTVFGCAHINFNRHSS